MDEQRISILTSPHFGQAKRHFSVGSALAGICQTGVVAAVAVVCAVSSADAAASFDWSDSEPGYSRPEQAFAKRQHKSRRHAGRKTEKQEKEAAKPQAPLIISISIQQQKLRVYDANGLFAETPISTGMRGHPTPMGVFSIIQKHKLHRSNIYSGAPMPYMQRITWSGVAMHAGVLPGYPASHGCIRMPMSFAVRMWGWTKMGARVVVTPAETIPERFSHPLLVAQKVAPVATPAAQPGAVPSAAKPDKSTDAEPALKPSDAAPARAQIRTADAGGILELRRSTLTDASPAGEKPEPPVATNDPSVDVVGAIKAETKPAAADAEKPVLEPAGNVTAAKPEAGSAATPKAADESKPGEKSVQATPDKQEPSSKPVTATEPAKDQSRSLDPNQAGVAKPEPASAPETKRRGPPIAVFISRKDGKLYARQNFAPLFDLPIAIAPSDRPLGTHVFTAQADKDDASVLRWSAVSLPVAARRTEPRDSDDRAARRRKIAGAVDMPPAPSADSAAEALDRLSIPPETIARIAAALSPGGSIILSDQGIAAGETGEGTDFIIRLR